jgi:type I restriction enzyme, R subunit
VQVSPNFSFLKVHDLQLVRLGSQAERYFAEDPNTCLIKLRQFGELLAQLVAATVGLYEEFGESQLDLLRRLESRGAIAGEALDLFHELRKSGNRATHSFSGEQRTALSNLKYSRILGIWFHRSYGGVPDFKPSPFVPPADPDRETAALRDELAALRAEVDAHRNSAQAALANAAEELELRQLAEELLVVAEAEAAEIKAKLIGIQAQTVAQPSPVVQQSIASAQQNGRYLDLDERETRRLIDAQLRSAGWEADTEEIRYSRGARPVKGRYLAISEWPTASGNADYALFAGLDIIGVVEAKRQSKNVSGDITQAKRYSCDFLLRGAANFLREPWGEYRVPFVFATNGREFLEQLRTMSGIWFCDLRRAENISRPLKNWYSPQDLIDLLAQDLDRSQQQLEHESFDYGFSLRPYQKQAIQAVETALAEDKRTILLAMATGTGKTKTSITLVYRLLKTKRFRRILFIVDRSALGIQTGDAFKETRMENLQTFADIFDVKELQDTAPDRDTKVHIATIQGMLKRLLYPADDTPTLTAGQYDCIIVDECHRGYLLDREMSDTELTFRDLNDYISKYRRVLDFFDAVKIGLTATPALHTSQIFGNPVYVYSYREAVIDGYLIDHEPPIRIKTALAEDGIIWAQGEAVQVFDGVTGQLDLINAPDEIQIEIEQFNKRVITEPFNQVICEQLVKFIDPALPEKTLIFCANNDHADLVVDLLKQALEDEYGSVYDEDVIRITGKSDKPNQLIRRFRNELSPKIAVTVDLLTTGIDVPAICNLVFIRRVNSRILYEQMVGRATRLCAEIGKEIFRIFDAVNLYENIAPVSTMKPVVVNPQISFEQMVTELASVTDDRAINLIISQLVAKLQRKRHNLSQEQAGSIEQIAGMPVADLTQHLRNLSPAAAAAWLTNRREIAQLLDRQDGGRLPLLISYHPDELRGIEYGYGNASRPEDYLDSFEAFLRDNLNLIPALLVVTQRPRELTRQQLKELRLVLDLAGYTQVNLQAAWRDATNQDIAASIIGFIRKAALGDALIPYSDRVDRAVKQILASQAWTKPQRQWLEIIAKQLKVEYVVDRSALDEGAFRSQGGFTRIDKVFDGKLESILADIQERLWSQVV